MVRDLTQIGTETDKIGDSTDAAGALTVFGEMYQSFANLIGSEWPNLNLSEMYDYMVNAYGDISGSCNSLVSNIGNITDNIGDGTIFALEKQITAETDLIGLYADADTVHSIFGRFAVNDAAVGGVLTQVQTTESHIRGANSRDLSQLAGGSFDTGLDNLHSIKGSVGGLVSPDNQGIADILTEVTKIGDSTNASGAATVFGRIYAARDTIMGLSGVSLTNVAGAGFDPAKHSLAYLATGHIARLLGMLHENSVLDMTTFDPATSNLLSGRLRIYSTKTDADNAMLHSQTDPPPSTYDTNKIAQYSIIAVYTGANLTAYEVALEWKAS
jgi:hypothetical protein